MHPVKRTSFITETAALETFASGTSFLEKFAFATEIILLDNFEGNTNGMVQVTTELPRTFMLLMDLIDRDKELARWKIPTNLRITLDGTGSSIHAQIAKKEYPKQSPVLDTLVFLWFALHAMPLT